MYENSRSNSHDARGWFCVSVWIGCECSKTKFDAYLSGKSEVPAVDSNAHGQAMFELSPDGKSLRYTLSVDDAKDVTMAQIHLGDPGKAGKPVAPLYPADEKSGTGSSDEKAGMMNGVSVKGTITAGKFIGPLKGKTIDDLVEQIRSGKTYVNVRTKGHPDGEIRGTIE